MHVCVCVCVRAGVCACLRLSVCLSVIVCRFLPFTPQSACTVQRSLLTEQLRLKGRIVGKGGHQQGKMGAGREGEVLGA